MIEKRDQYFNVNRILLLVVGLWPYQQSNFTRFQHIFISVTLTTFITFQLTPFLTLSCTLELLTKILSSVSFFVSFIIKYSVFYFHLEGVKNLLMQLQHVHNQLKDKTEIAIVKKYDSISTRYTIGLTILGICGVFSCIIVQYWSSLSNINLTTNASRSHHFLFMMEYFIDQEKYFYLILLHSNAALCIGVTTTVAIGAMLIAYLYHTCGMFKIAKLTKYFMSTMEVMMLCLIICGVASLSLNLFQIASSEFNIEKCLVPFVFALGCITYMFLANYIGQIVIDHNNYVFTTVYNVRWYKTPLHVQRMILFLLQRRTKEFTLNVGGLFDASVECFAMLMKASVSYFTVICSTR